MRWYVLQTKTGGEEKLADMIRKLLAPELYEECFTVYFEQLWRRRGHALVHVERAFPGYIFITSDRPEELYLSLKRVPAMSRLLADDSLFFLALDPAEADFLQRIMDADHVIRLSYLATDGHGRVMHVTEPLKSCMQQVVRYNYRKRNVIIRLSLAGAEKQVMLGIILTDDVRRQLQYGKVEIPGKTWNRYSIIRTDRASEPEGMEEFAPGDSVAVTSGDLFGMTGTVTNVKKHSVRMSIHFLDQKIDIEMPAENLQRVE